MGLNFQFATASQIIFGNNSLEKVPGLISELGRNVLLITGSNEHRAASLTGKLSNEINTVVFHVESEPTVQIIDEGVKIARESKCDVVVGFGGGSVIDTAKAIAALVSNDGALLDYLEVIGKGKKLKNPPLPCIAIPTTAGTGAEVTKNSVIKSPGHQVKVSLRSPLMYPKIAVADPVLTVSMPPEVTAATGADALTHLLETFVSGQANAFIDLLCREGMQRISKSLVKAHNNGNDLEAREDMALASLLGGMALANVKLGAVHGFAGPLGGFLQAPHGALCACLLPSVMETNFQALTEKNLKIQLAKYDEVAKILTGDTMAVAADGICWVKNLINELRIPCLSHYGLAKSDFQKLVGQAKKASSMKGNPVELDDYSLTRILEQSC